MRRSPILKRKKSPKETTNKIMKWAVSQRTGGAPDSEQYMFGEHRTVRWDTGQSAQTGP
jgi:hypothetical protein